jgi:dTDP-4-amino-4,6-dideoxygalactose transaminase
MTVLNKKGIPAAPWSDLSPEVKNSQKYPLSNALRREVITLPIHQDLTLAHIEWMAEEVIKSFKL